MYSISDSIVRIEPAQGRNRIGLGGFLVLTFALSWLGAAPMVLASWLDADSPAAWHTLLHALTPLQPLMFFGALISTLLATGLNHGRRGLRELFGGLVRWRVGIGGYLGVLAGPGLICIAAAYWAPLIDTDLPAFSLQASALLAVAQIFGVYLLLNTEELAWRGYALPQLQGRMRPLQANLSLALIWGAFHSPYFMMKGGHPGGYGVLIFALMVFAICMVMGMTFNATRGSILLCHLLHQSLNAWSEGLRLFPAMNQGSPWPFRIMVGGFACAGLVAAIWLWRHSRRRPVADALAGQAASAWSRA